MLPHSAGKAPGEQLSVPEARLDIRPMDCRAGKEPLPPHAGGKGPVKAKLVSVRVINSGKAVALPQLDGSVPAATSITLLQIRAKGNNWSP